MGSGSSNIALPPPWALIHLPQGERAILYPVPGTGEIIDFKHKVYVKPEKINPDLNDYYGNFDAAALQATIKEKNLERVDLVIDVNSREGYEFIITVLPKLSLDPAKTMIILITNTEESWSSEYDYYGHANEAYKLWGIIESIEAYSKCFVDRVFFQGLQVDQQVNAVGDICKKEEKLIFYPNGKTTRDNLKDFHERTYERIFLNNFFFVHTLSHVGIGQSALTFGRQHMWKYFADDVKFDFEFEKPKKPNCFERCGCSCCRAPKCCSAPKISCPCSAPKCCKPPTINVPSLPDLPKIDLPSLPEYKMPKKNRSRRKPRADKLEYTSNSFQTKKQCLLIGARAVETMMTTDCYTQVKPWFDDFKPVKNEEYVFVIDCTTGDLPESFVSQGWYDKEVKATFFAVILLPSEKTERCQQALSVVFEYVDNVVFINEGVDEGVNVIDGLLTCKNSLLDISDQINAFPRMKIIIPFYNDGSVALVTSLRESDSVFSMVNMGSYYYLWHSSKALDYHNYIVRMECDDMDVQLCQHLDGTIKILDMMTQDTVDGQGYKTAYDLKKDYEEFKAAVNRIKA